MYVVPHREQFAILLEWSVVNIVQGKSFLLHEVLHKTQKWLWVILHPISNQQRSHDWCIWQMRQYLEMVQGAT